MGTPFYFAFTVDDVALEGYSSPGDLGRLYGFLDDVALPATFFVVPRGEDGRAVGDRPGYRDALREGRARGHAFAQHGLDHDRFEVGVPPPMILELPHEDPAREKLENHRETIDQAHTVDAIRATLRAGRAMVADALGADADGFRAPSLQVCDNLWTALAEEGYRYDSSTCLQPTGWDILNGRPEIPPRPITRDAFLACRRDPRVAEFPLTADYAWYLTPALYDVTLALAQHDARACLAAGIPFVPVVHVSPFFAGEGERLWRTFAPWLKEFADREGAALQCLTLPELAQRYTPPAPEN